MTGDENRKSLADDKRDMARDAGTRDAGAMTQPDPEWATGLKRLYDSVVEETLPDSIRELLMKLDTDKSDADRDVDKQ